MSDLRVITPQATLSYPNLFAPRENQQGKLIYSAELVFGSDTDLADMKGAATAAAREQWGSNVPKGIRSPFDDRWEQFNYAEGSTFVRTNSQSAPGIVVGPKRSICTNPDEFYPGAIVIAELTARAYDISGSRGVKFFLNNIWKIRDGERLVKAANVADTFAGVELDADAFGSSTTTDSLL